MINTPRGFTLLISILLATVAVTLGVSLLDISYKQLILASTAKQSQFGFYAADTAMECALYYDQQRNAFSYTGPLAGSSISCNQLTVTDYLTGTQTENGKTYRKTSFSLPCADGGSNGEVVVYKYNTATTTIYANGYNSCSSTDPRRVERGLKVSY